MSFTRQIEYHTSLKKFMPILILAIVLCSSCGKGDVRSKVASTQGKPDKKRVYLRYSCRSLDLTVHEFWDYNNGSIVSFENQGYGFYLVDGNYEPVSKVPGPSKTKYQFSTDPKEMRQWLMKEYGRPHKIGPPELYLTYEKWGYNGEALELYIQIEKYVYRNEYGEGYTVNKSKE